MEKVAEQVACPLDVVTAEQRVALVVVSVKVTVPVRGFAVCLAAGLPL